MSNDRKYVAWSKKQRYEPQYVAGLFNIPVSVVKQAAIDANPHMNGKPTRTRERIYRELLIKGYTCDLKKLVNSLLDIPNKEEKEAEPEENLH